MSGTPTNSAIRKQLRRLKHIVSLLKRGDMNAQDILRDLEVNSHDEAHRMSCSGRTLRRDVATLRSEYGCPLGYRASDRVYYLKERSWNFPALLPSTVDNDEVLALVLGAKFARDILPSSISHGVERTVDEILGSHGGEAYLSRQRIGALKILVSTGPISELVFHTVFDAWRNCRCLTIDYCDAKDVRKQYLIEPQALVFHDMQWGLKAFCPGDQMWRVFLLSRISQAYDAGEKFVPDERQVRGITADTYFDFPSIDEVTIRLNKAGKQFATAHPLRSAQKITTKNNGEDFILRASAVSVPETLRWIFAQAASGDAIPLAPRQLVEQFRQRLEALLETIKDL